MAKPLTGLTVWGATTSGTTTQLDNNFSAVQAAINDLNTYSNYLADTGAANAYIVSLGAGLTGALTAGLKIQVKITNANTGAATLNYNGTGVLAIQTTTGGEVSTGMLIANGIYDFIYTGSVWQVQNPSAVGGWVLLSAKQANANLTIDFNNALSSTYDQYRLVITGLRPSGNDVNIAVRVGNSNAPTYQAAGYRWGSVLLQDNAIPAYIGSVGNAVPDRILISYLAGGAFGVYNGANAALSSEIRIATANANAPSIVVFDTGAMSSQFIAQSVRGSGYWNSNQTITSIQVLPSNGNITSGNFALYGIVRS